MIETNKGSPSGGRSELSIRPQRSHASRARTLALECLLKIQERDAFADPLIDAIIDRGKLSAEDKAFATLLVRGVVSTRGSLDLVLDRCMRSPRDVKDDVRCALRISAYEMLYLHKDAYASVSQGVELTREIAPRAAALANAVLRKVASLVDAFPFGDPQKDIHAYALLHGFPVWLVEQLIQDLGAPDAHAFLVASNEPAPIYLAVNSALASDDEICTVFKEARFSLEPAASGGITPPGCYELRERKALSDGRIARLLRTGKIVVSDASAQAIAFLVAKMTSSICADGKDPNFLELCAGRGTKTVLLQSDLLRIQSSQSSRFTTVDNVPFKQKLLLKRAQECGIEVSEALCGDATHLDRVIKDRMFDCIFIDAPCSGLGTLRRHPEIRWRIKPQDIDTFAHVDKRILESAAHHVRPGGLLAYATCTITPSEDGNAISSFLSSELGSSFKLASVHGKACFQNMLVPRGPDAHFLAVMQRL